ncbi:hypothetical protein [Flindersiella endophytica]
MLTDSRERPDDPVEHYSRLLFELSDAIDSIQCDRRLAMYRAYQHGMEPADIARRAHVEIADVQNAIESLSKERDVDGWPIAKWCRRPA